mgnify:CR=1 FL=1
MPAWLEKSDPRAYRTGAPGVDAFNEAIASRRQKLPYTEQKYTSVINDLKENGFAVLRQAINKEKLLNLKEEFERVIKDETNIKERNEHFLVAADPLLNCPVILELAFSDIVRDIASEYFSCTPALGTCNFRKSFINNSGAIKHQLFHSDPNSVKFIKFFFYLNDVDMEGGPFSIVKGSINRKFNGWLNKYRWSEDEMKRIYGSDSIIYATGTLGDIFIANTTAFHRGVPPRNNERIMLTLNYVVHPEDWKQPTFRIHQKDFDNLSDDKKPMADFLIKV